MFLYYVEGKNLLAGVTLLASIAFLILFQSECIHEWIHCLAKVCLDGFVLFDKNSSGQGK